MSHTVLLLWSLLPAAVPATEPPITLATLEGTHWAGWGADVGYCTYFFEPGGVLRYSYNGTTYRNATWKQQEWRLYFECNNKYYEFQGAIDGDWIVGKGWNVRGGKWELRLQRKNGP